MAENVSWGELKIGTIGAVAIVLLVLAILIFARVGALHGKTNTIYITTHRATGVLAGTEVWLAGQKVGLVSSIDFRPVTSDTMQRLAIKTNILADKMDLLRRDSYADIRAGGKIIGSLVIYLSVGTTGAPQLKDGDTLSTRLNSPMDQAGARVDTLGTKLTELADAGNRLLDRLKDPGATVGAFRTRGTGQVQSAAAIASSISDRATLGSGSIGLAYRGNIQARLGRVLAAKDSIILLLSSGSGNLGRFSRDSTLPKHVAKLRADVDSLSAMLSNPNSGVSRVQSDTALKNAAARARAQLDSLMREMKKHPMRYISF